MSDLPVTFVVQQWPIATFVQSLTNRARSPKITRTHTLSSKTFFAHSPLSSEEDFQTAISSSKISGEMQNPY
jgi:hypothetical protein